MLVDAMLVECLTPVEQELWEHSHPEDSDHPQRGASMHRCNCNACTPLVEDVRAHCEHVTDCLIRRWSKLQ